MNLFSWLEWQNPVALWWVSLSAASIVNISLWYWTFRYQGPRIASLSDKGGFFSQKNLIFLSAVYVFVCAFRSFLPRADVQRICLWDTWWSSVFVGRTLATFAELAFVTQWYIVLSTLAVVVGSKFVSNLSKSILPMIIIAEICSWYAVIRTHYIGNVIEESLWALTYFVIGVCIVRLLSFLKGPLLLAARFSVIGCILYVTFMVTVDVPMYVDRWLIDSQNAKPLLGFFDGLVDLNTRWHVTHSIVDWKTEIPWKTLYFTFAVLVSIALCYVPIDRKTLSKYLK
jgi:hypothetical protein